MEQGCFNIADLWRRVAPELGRCCADADALGASDTDGAANGEISFCWSARRHAVWNNRKSGPIAHVALNLELGPGCRKNIGGFLALNQRNLTLDLLCCLECAASFGWHIFVFSDAN